MSTKKRVRADYWLHLIDQIVQKRFRDPEFNVNALADDLGISTQRVYEIVKMFRKTTPQAMIETVRMDHAKNELQKTAPNCFEIASDCGFVHYSSFLRSFKRKCGMSPAQFGKTHPRYSQKNQAPPPADVVKTPNEKA